MSRKQRNRTDVNNAMNQYQNLNAYPGYSNDHASTPTLKSLRASGACHRKVLLLPAESPPSSFSVSLLFAVSVRASSRASDGPVELFKKRMQGRAPFLGTSVIVKILLVFRNTGS